VQDELAGALEFRDLALGILSHDLRNPLAAVQSAAQSIVRAPGLPEVSRRALAIIERSARRGRELIATLLDFADSRFHSAVPISPSPMKLGETVRPVIDELLAAQPHREISLDVRRDPAGVWDSARLAQVASNLLSNALKHGARDGVVRATIDADETSSVLSVMNHGEPIPAQLLPEIFKAFRTGRGRGDVSTQRGLGLGLYIADQIVRAHAGSIQVRSDPAGTIFSVRLPR
jgi:signal transduction histidine kinase